MPTERCFLPKNGSHTALPWQCQEVNKPHVQHVTPVQSRSFQLSVTCFVALLTKNKNCEQSQAVKHLHTQLCRQHLCGSMSLLKSHATKEFSALEQDQDAPQKRFLIPCSSPVYQARYFKRHLEEQGQIPVPIVLWGCYTQRGTQRAIPFCKLKNPTEQVFPPHGFHH